MNKSCSPSALPQLSPATVAGLTSSGIERYLSWDDELKLRSRLRPAGSSADAVPEEVTAFYGEIFRASLPTDLLQGLATFAEDPRQVLLVIRGLPRIPYPPPTPYDGMYEGLDLWMGEAALFGTAAVLDLRPIAYDEENGGHLVRHVVPARGAEREFSSHGSRVPFPFHADNHHRPLTSELVYSRSPMPEVLILYCIRNQNVPTQVIPVDNLLAALPPRHINALRRPEFMVYGPDSCENSAPLINVPLLISDPALGSLLRLDLSSRKDGTLKCQGNTPAAQRALEAVAQALGEIVRPHLVYLQPGDLIAFKNQRVVHAREAFAVRFDNTDRWLLRLYAVRRSLRGLPVDPARPHVWR